MDFLLRKKIKTHLASPSGCKYFLGFEEMRRVMVFFLPEQYDEAMSFVEHFRMLGKEAFGCTVLHKDFKGEIPDDVDNLLIFHEKEDFDWMGDPWSEVIDTIADCRCDTLIDLTLRPHLKMILLAAMMKGVFRVGVAKGYERLYHLTLQRVDGFTTSQYAQEIYKVLGSIRTA